MYRIFTWQVQNLKRLAIYILHVFFKQTTDQNVLVVAVVLNPRKNEYESIEQPRTGMTK